MSIQQIFESLPIGVYIGNNKKSKEIKYKIDKSQNNSLTEYRIYTIGYSIKETAEGFHIFLKDKRYYFCTLIGNFVFEGEFKWEWIEDLQLVK